MKIGLVTFTCVINIGSGDIITVINVILTAAELKKKAEESPQSFDTADYFCL